MTLIFGTTGTNPVFMVHVYHIVLTRLLQYIGQDGILLVLRWTGPYG